MTTGTTTEKALHWLMVGYISDGAKAWIEEKGGTVKQVCEDPALFAVGLAYNPAGAWTWSKGRREHRQGVEYWNTGELQEASTGITLQYGNVSAERSLAEYCSAHTNFLILPDEEIAPAKFAVLEPGAYSQPAPGATAASSDDGELGDLDDMPF